MRKRSVSAVLSLFWLISPSLFAQTTNATLGGTVTDSSGALIPGVSITATNTQTGIVTKLVTNESGAYQFASLQTGTYNVRAELPGFQAQVREAALGLGQQVRLNFTLQVGAVTQSVDVNVQTDTLIATTSASVGAVLPEYKVRDLPLATRNVLDLVNTTAGVQGSNFAGGRLTQLNTTRDGIPVSDGRYDIGAATSTYVSPDLVEELRIIVAPADAEVGRGSGQIQMVTRSGTNQYHGSLFLSNRNSFLNANTWNNNFNGVGKDYVNGNQFGGRVAGPVFKNKTFFFFLYDGQRFVTKGYFTGTVLTDQARQGNFRYFDNVQNANAIQNNPTVDLSGAPIAPIVNGQPLPLQTLSVFGKDPLRPAIDSSGWIQRLISKMPLPNDYTVGDGLNTAGIRWLRRVEGQDVTNGDGQDTNRNQYNVRIDHAFNSRHKASFSGSWERDWAMNDQAGIAPWPTSYSGKVLRKPRVFTGSLVSTLSPTLLNEFRFGTRKQWNYSWSSIWRPDSVGDDARASLPTNNGVPFYPTHILFPANIISNVSGAATRGQTSPLWDFSDTLSWTKGKHAFKGGFEARFTSSRGFNGSENPDWVIFPTVAIGAGSNLNNAVTGIARPGLAGSNLTTAQNLLLDLNGSVSNVTLQFNVHSPTDQVFTAPVRVKDYHQNEWAAFVKDDWKIRSDLTLNIGLRYDFYGVPWEKSGMQALPVGGNAGLYGISAGALTQLQLVGKNSNHPDTLLYGNDWNNFGPAVGFSWTLPWLGKDKTVVRGGYAINYQGAASYNAGLNIASGNNPGLSYIQNLTTLGLTAGYYNLSSPTLPVPVPPPTGIAPLATEPLDLRINPLAGFDQDRVNPYVQNYHFEIQRELARNLTFEARYIGSKGTKLYSGVSLNDVNVFTNGILNGFNQVRAGGDAPLFDQMLNGLTLNPATPSNPQAGQGVIGTNTTAAQALRLNTNFRTFLANGNVGQFASLLNTSTTGTGRAGGLVRNGGLPENFIVANPQYAAVVMNTNPGSSTYHALNLQVTKRLSNGFTTQFAYVWSRTLSDASGDGNLEYLDPRNPSLNHTLTTFHRTHDFRGNGTFELPFGPNKPFLNSGNSLVTRLVERWQLGGIFSWTSGQPLTITASNSELTWTPVPGQIAIARTSNTPLILGDFPKSFGKVTTVDKGAYYFAGLRQCPSTTECPNLRDPAYSVFGGPQQALLQGAFGNKAIFDESGNLVLANPAPGTVGTLGRMWIEGPGHIGWDMNLVKRVKIAEQKEFEIRMDVVNILNTPYWANPNVDINNASFGRIQQNDATGASNADFRNGNRRFVFSGRISF
jgi:Carboxypeptidase regulatory-like domain